MCTTSNTFFYTYCANDSDEDVPVDYLDQIARRASPKKFNLESYRSTQNTGVRMRRDPIRSGVNEHPVCRLVRVEPSIHLRARTCKCMLVIVCIFHPSLT